MSKLARLLLFFTVTVLTLLGSQPDCALADSRVALVIGNSAYRAVPQLRNPANDASDVADSLKRLGFTVDLLRDAGFDELRRALIAFGAKAREADMAIVYFAGHGMELGGENWAVPVDASLASDSDVESEAIGLKSLTLAVSGASGLGLVILDACRNDPFGGRMQRSTRTRAMTRGLAPIEPTGNVLVAFAAKDGTTATDGDGRNSPFTAALLNHLETPGLEIDFLLRNVRGDVLAATNGQQQPFAYGSLSRQAVYLKPASADTGASAPPAPAADDVAWPYVATSSDAELVRRFTKQYPASRHRAEADQRLAVLEAAAATPASASAGPMLATKTASLGQSDAGSASPPAQGPDPSTPEQTAVARQFNGAAPQVEQAWSLIKTSGDAALLRRFTAEFPSRDRQIVSAALNGIGSTTGVLRQLHADEMHAVLAGYGRFVTNARYGEVWVPGVTPAGWQPYEPCHWVKTRQFDWFYLDRTPWGAITHHYGHWAHEDQLGWIWVPGVDFSPGWVVWQTTPEQVGWAPMPPAEDVHQLTAAQLGNADFWTFMDRADFMKGCGAPRPAKPLLQKATFVREIRVEAGIPVFVLPVTLPGDPVDVTVAFDPWPTWLVSETMVGWNAIWALGPALCAIAPVAPVKLLPATAPPPPPPAPAPVKGPGKAKHPPQQTVKKPIRQTAPVASDPPPPRRRVTVDRQDPPVVIAEPPPEVYYPRPMPRPIYPIGGFGMGGFGGSFGGGGFGRGGGGMGTSMGRGRY